MLNKYKKYYALDQSEIIPDTNPCYIIEITVLVPENIVFTTYPCAGGTSSVTLNGDGITNPRIYTLCSRSLPTTEASSSKYRFQSGGDC